MWTNMHLCLSNNVVLGTVDRWHDLARTGHQISYTSLCLSLDIILDYFIPGNNSLKVNKIITETVLHPVTYCTFITHWHSVQFILHFTSIRLMSPYCCSWNVSDIFIFKLLTLLFSNFHKTLARSILGFCFIVGNDVWDTVATILLLHCNIENIWLALSYFMRWHISIHTPLHWSLSWTQTVVN